MRITLGSGDVERSWRRLPSKQPFVMGASESLLIVSVWVKSKNKEEEELETGSLFCVLASCDSQLRWDRSSR